MKNYIIGIMAVIILFLISVIYKNNKPGQAGMSFPVQEEIKDRVNKDVDVPLYLFVFFSRRNCHDCLQVIQELNHLGPQFIVTGIVPQNELNEEKELRAITGAAFPLVSMNQYNRFLPWYTPSIIGVSPDGIILFSLPGVPQQSEYIKKFLDSLYGKLLYIFLREKGARFSVFKSLIA